MGGSTFPHDIFFRKMDKKLGHHTSRRLLSFQNLGRLGGSVAEGVVGKYIALVGNIPCPLLLGRWFCRDAGSVRMLSGDMYMLSETHLSSK